MSAYALFLIMLAFCLASGVFALVKGGTPERIGAAIILANLVAVGANDVILHDQRVLLAIDGLTAMALLPITLRYASVWLGAVMLLYGLQFGLHAFYFVLERPKDALHVWVNNANFFTISAALAIGTVLSLMRRRPRPAPTLAMAQPPAPTP
jgi:hypothetical protein